MVTRIFQLLLLVSPVGIGTDINMDMFDLIFFRTGIIILFLSSLIDKPKRELPGYITKVVLGLFGLVIWNLFVHTFDPKILATSMDLFLAFIGFYIVYIYYDEKQSLRKYILWAGAINLLLFISQKIGFDPVWDKHPIYNGLEGAFFGNKMRLITYFALLTPFLPLWLLPLSIGLGLYTHQYIIFIPVVVMLFMLMKTKRTKIGFGIVCILAGIFVRQSILNSLAFRFNMAWKQTLVIFFKQPFIGLGLGVQPIYGLDVIANSYLQFISGVGILGAVWYGYVFYNLRDTIAFNKYTLPLISLILIMSLEYAIEIMRYWYLIIGILIIALIKGVRTNACSA